MTAVGLISLSILSSTAPKMTDLPSTLYYSVVALFGGWLAYSGVYRVKGLHYLWGGVGLASTVFLAALCFHTLTGPAPFQPHLSLDLVVTLLALSMLAYLLLIDKRVREYRRVLK